jgi:amidohydrolase
MIGSNQIKEEVKAIESRLIAWRRHLHANPEISFKEYKTSEYLQEELKSVGINDFHVVCETGIYGFIGEGEETIILRGDIDALPIQENNNVAYKSKEDGLMHACGHDVHSTCLLGALSILKKYESDLPYRVMYVFQPGEEQLPGGASLMIKEGIFDGVNAKMIIGQHVYPELEVGKVAFKEGIYMASCDELYISVQGKGGHGALPHKNIDPILIGAHIVTAIQQMVSRHNDPRIPTVVSIGEFIANGATNVCPDKAEMKGTIRTFNEEWRADLHVKLIKLIKGIGESMGAEIIVRIDKGYPYLENHIESTQLLKSIAQKQLGEGHVEDLEIRMTAEDFSYYSQILPACFYRLGVRNESKGITSSVHSPTFDIDERALSIGVEVFVASVMNTVF